MSHLGLRILMVVVVVVAASACGDDGTSSVPDVPPDINGSWTYNLTFSGGGLTCTYDPSPVTIIQAGSTFTGRIDVPDATCTFEGGDPFSLGDFGNNIVNGTINTSGAVTFDFVTPEKGHHVGTASASSMSGTLTAMDEGVTHTGTWTANR